MFLYTDASFLVVIEDSPWPTCCIVGSDKRVMPKQFCNVIGIMTFRKYFFDYIFVCMQACVCVANICITPCCIRHLVPD